VKHLGVPKERLENHWLVHNKEVTLRMSFNGTGGFLGLLTGNMTSLTVYINGYAVRMLRVRYGNVW
jgi:hypothetical protein